MNKQSRYDLILKKYERRINRLIKKMANNTMQELWVELDKLKVQLAEELDKEGISIEGTGYNMDTKDESSNARPITDNISSGCNRVQ